MEHFKQRSIRKPDISLSHFKSELYLYYWSALLQVYKVDDPRTCMEVGRSVIVIFFVVMHTNHSQSVDPEVTREKRLDTRLSIQFVHRNWNAKQVPA
jgi:hypothetical protein